MVQDWSLMADLILLLITLAIFDGAGKLFKYVTDRPLLKTTLSAHPVLKKIFA
jgi:hypothetical protein